MYTAKHVFCSVLNDDALSVSTWMKLWNINCVSFLASRFRGIVVWATRNLTKFLSVPKDFHLSCTSGHVLLPRVCYRFWEELFEKGGNAHISHLENVNIGREWRSFQRQKEINLTLAWSWSKYPRELEGVFAGPTNRLFILTTFIRCNRY